MVTNSQHGGSYQCSELVSTLRKDKIKYDSGWWSYPSYAEPPPILYCTVLTTSTNLTNRSIRYVVSNPFLYLEILLELGINIFANTVGIISKIFLTAL